MSKKKDLSEMAEETLIQVNTGTLVTSGDFGKALIESAIQERRETLKKACIAEVESVLTLIELTETRIKEQQHKLEIYRARLAAIEQGRIRLNPNVSGLKIMYEDDRLTPEKSGI